MVRYVGQFKNNEHNGNGRYEFVDGGVYNGSFVKGLRDGKGTMNYVDNKEHTCDVDGVCYEGEWRENCLCGTY